MINRSCANGRYAPMSSIDETTQDGTRRRYGSAADQTYMPVTIIRALAYPFGINPKGVSWTNCVVGGRIAIQRHGHRDYSMARLSLISANSAKDATK